MRKKRVQYRGQTYEVAAHVRKKGVKVKAYCRRKPRRSTKRSEMPF